MTFELLAALVVVFAAGSINGLTGFGFALVVVPPLLLIYDPKTVVALRVLVSLASAWLPLVGTWREADRSILVRLVPWACVGMILGIVGLERVPAAGIKLVASSIVLAFALVLIIWKDMTATKRANSALSAGVAGFTSGAMATSTGLSGPPVIMFLTMRGLKIRTFRPTIMCYFLALDTVSIVLLVASGVVHQRQFEISLTLLPAALVGRFVGMTFVKRVSQTSFRHITLCLLVVTGSIGIVNALVDLAK